MAEQLTHWKKLHNPDYLGVYALEVGKDLIVTIREIKNEMVVGVGGKKEECSVMHFAEHNIKPMIVNATNFKMMQKLFKTPFYQKWYGQKIQLYADYNVKFGGETVEGLRIRDFLPDLDSFVCADCTHDIKPAGKMTAEQTANYTRRKYGRPLCAGCASREAETARAAAVNPLADKPEQGAPEETGATRKTSEEAGQERADSDESGQDMAADAEADKAEMEEPQLNENDQNNN